MNERIIKLGLDSHMLNYIDNETPRRYFLSGHADEDDLQKFAELIVRECAQFIFVLDAEPVSHKSAARMLQEHFGVEE